MRSTSPVRPDTPSTVWPFTAAISTSPSTHRQRARRLARFSDPDASGVYRTRHDFVHSIPTGTHGINQIQIVGSTLYVGIGAASRKGDPAVENVYTMTVARIVDLAQTDFSGPIGADFKGPVNNLADPVEWLNTGGADGKLRYYASGFRNPFGIVDRCRRRPMAVSTNGNSDPGFLSPDLSVPGRFRWGARATSLPRPSDSACRMSPAPRSSRSRTSARVRRRPAWPSCRPARTRDSSWWRSTGRPTTRPWDGMSCSSIPSRVPRRCWSPNLKGPTDVAPDPFGRLLIADINDSSVWLLTYTGAADVTPPVAGAITPFNTRYGNWVDSPFDLSASFRDNESAVTSCEVHLRRRVDVAAGGRDGSHAELHLRRHWHRRREWPGPAAQHARDERGGTAQGTALIGHRRRAASDGIGQNQQQRRVDASADGDPRARRDGCEWCGLDVHQQHIVVHGLAAVRVEPRRGRSLPGTG